MIPEAAMVTDNREINTGNVSTCNAADTLDVSRLNKADTLARVNTESESAAGPENRKTRRVLVVGAGAAGLMAAISAADCGAKVTVLEHKDKPGIKLAITGNGRCNYTNTYVSADKYHCEDAHTRHFVEEVLCQFGFEDSIGFFKSIGIEPEIRHYSYDESGYVYPKEMNAQGFRDIMYQAALKRKVDFHFGVSDDKVIETVLNNTRYDAVIIATGSNAYPVTGSDSSVYPVFKQLGIKTERFLPALCALYSKDEQLGKLKGRRIKTEVRLGIYEEMSGQAAADKDGAVCDGVHSAEDRDLKSGKAAYKKITGDNPRLTTYSEAGEIQFNEHSISGIPVMQLSRYAAKALKAGEKAVLNIDGHDYEIHRTAGFDRSQTCTGGIPAGELDPHTMRHSSGLYFCGEIIDIDGECGGYNLQFAWSTGFIAGRAAADSFS